MTARMRTISEAIREIKAQDPSTAFTETALRRMIKAGNIPSVKIGAKYLINLDVLYQYLANPEPPRPTTIISASGIKPVKEKIFS